ncbi:MAG: dihydrolipoamide acyltransferase [Bacteroidetes bacterium]|nr:MAG: dihydrolipoamide acyltransferase [Bacteroidota bacterium]
MGTFSEIQTGVKGSSAITVEPKDTARAYGSGLIEVFATPAMIALMERAAHESVQPLLPDGYLTVGSEVNVKHIKATGLKKQVRAESMLMSAEGKKLTFKVEAYDEEGKIGFGTHTRYIVEEKPFMQSL